MLSYDSVMKISWWKRNAHQSLTQCKFQWQVKKRQNSWWKVNLVMLVNLNTVVAQKQPSLVFVLLPWNNYKQLYWVRNGTTYFLKGRNAMATFILGINLWLFNKACALNSNSSRQEYVRWGREGSISMVVIVPLENGDCLRIPGEWSACQRKT